MSYVLQMIEEGEHQTQDFKMRVDNARKIAKTIFKTQLLCKDEIQIQNIVKVTPTLCNLYQFRVIQKFVHVLKFEHVLRGYLSGQLKDFQHK